MGGVPAEAPLTSICLGLVSLPLIFGAGLLAPRQKDMYSDSRSKPEKKKSNQPSTTIQVVLNNLVKTSSSSGSGKRNPA